MFRVNNRYLIMRRHGSRNKGVTGLKRLLKVPELADTRFGLKRTGSEFILLFIFLKRLKSIA